ncbi:MAG: hypothetical protein JKY48_08915, partial [Flavobacteriales bacterium]|nr:hypothetical protein [Flavobacteriales bacterium]
DDELKVSGSYDTLTKTASLSFDKIPSLGQVLTFLIKAAEPGMDLILPDPWDILNDIKIPGHITLDYDFKNKAISIEFDFDIDLVVIKLTSIKATYIPKSATQEKQVTIAVTGSLITGEDFSPGWNALQPQTAPKVPGKAAPFELMYLGVGQHVKPTNFSSINTVSEAISSLAGTFNQDSTGAKKGKPTSGTGLEYDAKAGWLIGADFSILDVFQMGFVFLDPLLYGLVVGVKAKPSAKPFGGLQFEIMYKKVNDTTGMYYIYLTLPTIMRNLQFGEVSVTLPSLKLWIYTDGSFKIDLGFPYHNNWKDSFGLEVFPFVGMGGFYFGVLKGADVKSLPNTFGNGIFNPVIELGVPLRVGVGKDINEGILSAGVSLTVAGIFQGMMTFYHPRNGSDKSIYFTISAMLAIIGKIYGSISFAIISARLNITAAISARATFALYEPIHLNFKAYVSVELTVSIHLLFTIHIHLKFHATIKEAFTIGHSTTPPWGTGPMGIPGHPPKVLALFSALKNTPVLSQENFNTNIHLNGPEDLKLVFSPHYTTHAGKAQGVLMTYIDSYSYKTTEDPATAKNSFANFGTGMLRWLAMTVLGADNVNITYDKINTGNGTVSGAAYLDTLSITSDQLQQLADFFASNNDQALGWIQALDFVQAFFDITINMPHKVIPAGGKPYNGTVFPMIPLLTVKVPSKAKVYGSSSPSLNPISIKFSEASSINGYDANQLNLLNEYLQFLKVNNQNAADQVKPESNYVGSLMSAAQIIFVDFITMIAKQVVQDSQTLFKETDVETSTGNNFTSFISSYGLSTSDYPQIIFDNRNQAFDVGFSFQMATVTYQLKKSDITNPAVAGSVEKDLTKIASTNFYGKLTGAEILAANPSIHKVMKSGTDTVVLVPGETISIPPFVQVLSALTGVSNLLELANHYHVTIQNTVDVQLRLIKQNDWSKAMSLINQQKVMNGIFATGASNKLRLCKLKQTTVGNLIAQLKANSTFANLSGMTARFMMHGLQLPTPSDVQKAVNHQNVNLAGLYLLTQQQIGVSNIVLDDIMTLSITPNPSSPLTNVKIPEPTYTFGASDIAAIAALNTSFTAEGAFPSPMTVDMFMTKEKHFALANKINVSTPKPFTTAVGPDTLWKLDPHLLQVLQNQPTGGYSFQLYLKRQITQNNVEAEKVQDFYMPSTLLKFQVRKVKVEHETNEFLPNIYEIHSVDAESIRLLTEIEEAGNNTTAKQFRLMYPDKAILNGYETPHQLIDSGSSNATAGVIDLFMVQSNLSEVADPIPNTTIPLTADEANQQLTRYLLESGVVHTGGYYLYYKNPHTQKALPEHLFSTKQPDTEITLLISYQYPVATNNNYAIAPYQNYIAYQGQINTDNENLFLESYADPKPGFDSAVEHKAPTAPPGSAGFEFQKTAVEWASNSPNISTIIENLFHMVSYNLVENADFNASQAGQPMGPLKQNDTKSTYNNLPLSNTGDSSIWNFEAMTSVYPWLKVKPIDTDPNMPTNSENPYIANGKEVQFQMNWVDLFGNDLLATPYKSPAIKIAYTDAIVQLSEWPNLMNSYQILQDDILNKKVKIKANFSINYSPFTPESNRKTHLVKEPTPLTPQWVSKAQNSLEKYKHIYYQYTAATVDTDPDMIVQLGSSIGFPGKLGGTDSAFDPSVNQVNIQSFIHLIKRFYVYLKGISNSDLKILPHQILSNKHKSIAEIASEFSISTVEELEAFTIANEGLAFDLLVGSKINIPAFQAHDADLKGLKKIQLFSYTSTSANTITTFTTTWLMDLAFFEVLNPYFAGKGGTCSIALGTTLYCPVYNYIVQQENQTLAMIATTLSIDIDLLNITNSSWKSASIPLNTQLLIPVAQAQVNQATVSVPETAPFRLFKAVTTITNFSSYSGISATTIKTLNPSLASGDTIPAGATIILPSTNVTLDE